MIKDKLDARGFNSIFAQRERSIGVNLSNVRVFISTFNALSSKVSEISRDHGFQDKWNDGEKIALMHSELSEALEALRRHLPCFSEKIPFLELEEELADTVIRIMEFAAYRNLDVAGAILEKIHYNSQREYKHGKGF